MNKEQLQQKITELEQEMYAPDFWSDKDRACPTRRTHQPTESPAARQQSDQQNTACRAAETTPTSPC